MNSGGSSRVRVLALIFFLLLVTACIAPELLELSGYLVFGWVGYLKRVVPQTQVSWSGIGAAVLSLGGVILLGHMMSRWLWRESDATGAPGRRPWKWTWTMAGVLIVVLMFMAGIAAVGVTHQSVWLAKSTDPSSTRKDLSPPIG